MNPQMSQPAPQQNQNYDPTTKVDNALTVTQPGEQTICSIKRHPIGLLSVYIANGFLLIVIAAIAFVLLPHIISGGSGTAIGVAAFLIFAVISLIFTFISNKVYWGNSWILTTDSLTQINQNSLFNRESSQLSLGNVEDVTAEQNGILPHMFNYGWLRIETASEKGKFVFQFCPNPNFYAQQLLSARESFMHTDRREPTAYQAPVSQQPTNQ